jgi:HSP20 family molecular chaperone IbpA
MRNGRVLRIELPDLGERDVVVTVRDGTVTVYGVFARTVPLPAGVNTDDIKATLKGSVLELHLPRAG